ncbi:MAG: tyrosine--tRNA ligase [Firmicutes bacterium]|nr:tyrosine--tRNA ligase [Bacillota bacterium]
MKSAEEQFFIIQDGTEEIIPVEEFKEKLNRSVSSGVPLKIKYGVDPTAPDLHLGHAVTLRKLRQFQDLGHIVQLLIGDYTARVGDPTERSTTRPQLPAEVIEANAKTYTDQAFKILDREKTEIVYNGQWFSEMPFERVLKITAQFTVARMLERDDFAKRFAAQIPISLHEFLYPVMQGYDSVELKCDVEIGGTDQKFNMLAGRDLQRWAGQEPQVVITMPILEGTDGVVRMSKSKGNYIGLTEPPEEQFGKIMSIPDSVMIRYYRLCTNVPHEEIDRIEAGLEDGTLHPNEIKRRLAKEIISIYYSPQAAEEAERIFDAKFKKVVGRIAAERLVAVGAEIPEVEITPEMLTNADRIWIVKLITAAGFAKTNGEARRLIEGGGVRYIEHEDGEYKEKHITDAGLEVVPKTGDMLQVGKRRIARIVVYRAV